MIRNWTAPLRSSERRSHANPLTPWSVSRAFVCERQRAPRPGCGIVAGCARARSLCVPRAHFMPLASTRPPWHAPVHVLIMLHMLSSVRSPRAGGSREVAASGHTSSRSWAAGDWAGWFGARGDWMQLVLLCGCVCVARTRRAISTSIMRVQHAMAEVGVCVAPEPHGLGEGSPNACAMVVACTVVGPVAVGCSWARYTVIYGRTIFFRFLD